jgi:hypothetical protein
MKVSSGEEEFLSVGRQLFRDTRRCGTVARAKSGINDKDGPAPDNYPDVGPPHNGPDMLGNFGCLLAEDRPILSASEKMDSERQGRKLGVHNRSLYHDSLPARSAADRRRDYALRITAEWPTRSEYTPRRIWRPSVR